MESINTAGKSFDSILNNIKTYPALYAAIAIALSLYGPRLDIKLPPMIKKLLSTPLFNFAIIGLIILLSSCNIQLALILALSFTILSSINSSNIGLASINRNIKEQFVNWNSVKEFYEGFSSCGSHSKDKEEPEGFSSCGSHSKDKEEPEGFSSCGGNHEEEKFKNIPQSAQLENNPDNIEQFYLLADNKPCNDKLKWNNIEKFTVPLEVDEFNSNHNSEDKNSMDKEVVENFDDNAFTSETFKDFMKSNSPKQNTKLNNIQKQLNKTVKQYTFTDN